jgi:hypothetical protein
MGLNPIMIKSKDDGLYGLVDSDDDEVVFSFILSLASERWREGLLLLV